MNARRLRAQRARGGRDPVGSGQRRQRGCCHPSRKVRRLPPPHSLRCDAHRGVLQQLRATEYTWRPTLSGRSRRNGPKAGFAAHGRRSASSATSAPTAVPSSTRRPLTTRRWYKDVPPPSKTYDRRRPLASTTSSQTTKVRARATGGSSPLPAASTHLRHQHLAARAKSTRREAGRAKLCAAQRRRCRLRWAGVRTDEGGQQRRTAACVQASTAVA